MFFRMKSTRLAYVGLVVALSNAVLAESIVTFDQAVSNCPPLGAVLPPPRSPSTDPYVQALVSQVGDLQSQIISQIDNATGLSIALGSVYEDEPLLNLSYTPPEYNSTGTHSVDADTVFRIGSVSKVFIVMGLLLLGDKISLADPITKYVPELKRLKAEDHVHDAVTTVDWSHISLDALASQIAGVGYDLGNDLGNNPSFNGTQYGLPLLTSDEHSGCGDQPSSRSCEWEDFWHDFGKRAPTYGPWTTPAYSDVTYDILGLVIERVSNLSYGDYIQEMILKPLNMTRTSVTKPDNDSIGFISSEANFWSTSYGFLQADGGFYSTANDLLRFGQGILGHKLLPETVTRQWLKPRTHTSSLGISVGAPWEIGRANNLTVDGRIIDVYSKNGGLTDYNAFFVLIPDYGLVMSMVSAGPASSLSMQLGTATTILTPAVRAFEAAGKTEASEKYSGTYDNVATNSSITVTVDDEAGLNVTSFVMNGQDILATYPLIASFGAEGSTGAGTVASYLSVRLYPTGLQNIDSTAWRAVYDTTAPDTVSEYDQSSFILQSACQSWATIDNIVYGYRGLDDFVFDFGSCDGNSTSITPRAFRQTLTRAN